MAFFNADKNFIKSKEHGSGNTALHMACRHGHFVSIGEMISRHLYLNFLRRPKKTENEMERNGVQTYEASQIVSLGKLQMFASAVWHYFS